jgi:hypothetical protein
LIIPPGIRDNVEAEPHEIASLLRYHQTCKDVCCSKTISQIIIPVHLLEFVDI